jgi:hypothetical protein
MLTVDLHPSNSSRGPMQWRTFALPPRLPFSAPTAHSDCRGGGSEALCTAMRRRRFGTCVISVSYQARSLLDPPVLRPETRGPGSCLVSEPVCVCYLLYHVVQLSLFFTVSRRWYSLWLDGTRSVSMLLAAPPSSTIIPPVCGRRRSLRVVLNVHTHRVSG